MALYFSPATDPKLFSCHCGECPPDFKVKPSQKLLDTLDELREQYGHPLIVTSGVRCPAHNAKVGGVVESEHVRGEAADLSIAESRQRFYLIQAAHKVGIARVGIAATFIHVGVGTLEPQCVTWLYGVAEHAGR